MINQYVLLADSDLCVGCYACVIACKQENNLPEGVRYINISIEEAIDGEGKIKLSSAPIHCMHCEEPSCIASCPELAIRKRGDGIVIVDEDICTGCGLCVEVCPIGAINIASGPAAMCHMCHHRIETGLEPSCVMHCFTKALRFGFHKDFIAEKTGEEIKCTINCKSFVELRGRN